MGPMIATAAAGDFSGRYRFPTQNVSPLSKRTFSNTSDFATIHLSTAAPVPPDTGFVSGRVLEQSCWNQTRLQVEPAEAATMSTSPSAVPFQSAVGRRRVDVTLPLWDNPA